MSPDGLLEAARAYRRYFETLSPATLGELRALVRYEGAEEWYAVTGASCRLADEKDHEAVHAVLLGVLNRPEG